MKLKSGIWTFILFTLSFIAKGQDNNLDNIKAFINDISNDKFDNHYILEKHLHQSKDTGINKANEVLILQLNSLRNHLKENGPQKSVTYRRYVDLPLNERDILIDKKEWPNIYDISLAGKPLIRVWIKKGKIVSFNTMNKGGKKVFLII